MEIRHYIGADLGTSSIKLILTDQNGNVINSVTREYPVEYPKSGWAEQSPNLWWDNFVLGVKELTKDKELNVSGIGVSGQMHGLVILDEFDNVIRPAILWNDGRTDKETEYLNKVIGKEKLLKNTSNIAFAGFTAPKLLWLKNNEPENFGKIKKIMLPKDYINYKLTGVFATDYSDASGTLLLDVKNKRWSNKMLEVCGIELDKMPALYESYEKIGTVKPEVLKLLDLNGEVIVCGGAGDNAGAAIANGTISNGKCNISLGTSGTLFISFDNPVSCGEGIHSFCHANGKFHLLACILSAASCNKWFIETILGTKDYVGVQNGILEEKLGNNGVYFLPYLMGERSPINDTNATGVFIGLRPNTTKEDMLLAIMEGVSFAVRDNIEEIIKSKNEITSATVCGGGAKSKLWLKVLANVLNVSLNVLEDEGGPSLGSAYLAMLATKEYSSVKDLPNKPIKTVVEPDKNLSKLYEKRYKNFKKIYPSIRELYKEIKD